MDNFFISSSLFGDVDLPLHEYQNKWERVTELAEEHPSIKHHLDELRVTVKMITGEDL